LPVQVFPSPRSEDLQAFPAANANVAIFGTQSSGKSTLLNNVFFTKFPVLDTSVARERCTKGVWFHNTNHFNVIDTEGFDSEERAAN
jgi:predicted GTPase